LQDDRGADSPAADYSLSDKEELEYPEDAHVLLGLNACIVGYPEAVQLRREYHPVYGGRWSILSIRQLAIQFAIRRSLIESKYVKESVGAVDERP
jgi:hypothetical protein